MSNENTRFYINLFKLAVKTQLHQPLLSALKHPNNNCVVVVDIEKYVTHGNYHSNKF